MNNAEVFTSKKMASFIAVLLFAMFSIFTSFTFAQTANAAPIEVEQCLGTDNVGGQNVECTVTVVNNLNQATGLATSTLTVVECHGAANAVPTCVTTTTNNTDLVLEITQCDGSGNGGGGTVNCSVNVTNNVTGAGSASPVTINQCVGSGGGGGTEPTVVCSPLGSTTNATVTQCNGSGNLGGGDNRVLCTVNAAGTETSLIPVKISQCNGSGNDGGAYVTCSSIVNSQIIPAPVVETVSSVPTNLTTVVSGSVINITWDAPADEGGAPVTSYDITIAGDDGSSATTSTTGTEATTTTITAGVTYTVTVVAVNSFGDSPAATSIITVPAVVGGPPVNENPPIETLPVTGVETVPMLLTSGGLLALGIVLIAFNRKVKVL